MATVIVAGVLGVILITGGLFLRRLLGQLAELRRQITGIDREMRAQRAQVTVLRHLLADEEDVDGPPGQAAVVNGGPPVTPTGPDPVRRKGHLGLHLGGVTAAALATISTVAREALRDHRAQLVAVVTGAAVTATTLTMVTVQPWRDGAAELPPSSVPTAASPSYEPPMPPGPEPTDRAPGSGPPPTAPEPSPSATTRPRGSLSTTVWPSGSASPAAMPETLPGATTPGNSPSQPPGQTRRPTTPGQTHTPEQPGQTRAPGPPSEPPGKGRGRGLPAHSPPIVIDAGVSIVFD